MLELTVVMIMLICISSLFIIASCIFESQVETTDPRYECYCFNLANAGRMSILDAKGNRVRIRFKHFRRSMWVDRWIKSSDLPKFFVDDYRERVKQGKGPRTVVRLRTPFWNPTIPDKPLEFHEEHFRHSHQNSVQSTDITNTRTSLEYATPRESVRESTEPIPPDSILALRTLESMKRKDEKFDYKTDNNATSNVEITEDREQKHRNIKGQNVSVDDIDLEDKPKLSASLIGALDQVEVWWMPQKQRKGPKSPMDLPDSQSQFDSFAMDFQDGRISFSNLPASDSPRKKRLEVKIENPKKIQNPLGSPKRSESEDSPRKRSKLSPRNSADASSIQRRTFGSLSKSMRNGFGRDSDADEKKKRTRGPRHVRTASPIVLRDLSHLKAESSSSVWSRDKVLSFVRNSMEELRNVFGFQKSNCEAQAAHIVELWRSSIGEDSTPESLKDGIHRTHTHLLSGYENWLSVILEERTSVGVDCLKERSLTKKKLHECCLFLLIWGEAANLRFMPEMCAFIFHCARHHRPGIRFGKLDFLHQIVRPVYLHVCHARYKEFNEKGRPQKKENIRDPLNYDDWNELFWSRRKLEDHIKTFSYGKSASIFMMSTFPSESVWAANSHERYQMLRFVDWSTSLSRRAAHSHAELHFWWCILAGYQRVIALHALIFGILVSTWWPWDMPLVQLANALMFPSCVNLICTGCSLILTDSFSRISPILMVTLIAHLFPVVLYIPAVAPKPDDDTVMAYIVISAVIVVGSLLGRDFHFVRDLVQAAEGERRIDDAIRYSTTKWVTGFSFWVIVFVTKYFFFRPFGKILSESHAIIVREGVSSGFGERGRLSTGFRVAVVWGSGFASFFVQTIFIHLIVTAVFGFLNGFYLGLHVNIDKMFPCLIPCLPKRRPAKGLPGEMLRKLLGVENSDVESTVENKYFQVTWNRIVLDLASNFHISRVERNALLIQKGSGVRQWLRIAERIAQLRSHEARRRLDFFARSMKSRMPAALGPKGMPAFTVLIPHYADPIISPYSKLCQDGRMTENMKLLVRYHAEDAENLLRAFEKLQEDEYMRRLSVGDAKARARTMHPDEALRRRKMFEYWASMREQTLYRTVQGMLQYGRALDLLLEFGGVEAKERVREIPKRFQVLLAMQRFAEISQKEHKLKPEVDEIRGLMKSHPWLEIAYLEDEKLDADDQALKNERRYYSCLLSQRRNQLKVQLPGNPILGNGKGDNQNHALVFTLGRYIQAIDANQEHYYEEALKILNILHEFKAKPISLLGLREHIFSSSQGTMADFSGTSELVFGTLIQRTLQMQMARLHYGHPDIMDKVQMMQQGGLSSATEGINLNEDIFAGMNLMLRGHKIGFKEYMQVGKARDMGFVAIMGFYEKLGRGAAEQSITRQHLRMGQRLPLHRLLSFFYGHLGFYITHYLLACTIWFVCFMLLYFSLSEGEGEDEDLPFQNVARAVVSEIAGPLLLMLMFATATPALAALWAEEGFLPSITRILIVWQLTLAPLHFTFQSGVTGYAFGNTLLGGGRAAYIATGRGLGIRHFPFPTLYAKYAASNIAPAAELLLMLVSAMLTWRTATLPPLFWVMMTIFLSSWLLAPYMFNPQQFEPRNALVMWAEWLRWISDGCLTGPKPSQKESWRAQRAPGLAPEPQSVLKQLFTVLSLGLLLQGRELGSRVAYGFFPAIALWIPWEAPFMAAVFAVLDALAIGEGRCGRFSREARETVFTWAGAGFLALIFSLVAAMIPGLYEGGDASAVLTGMWYKYFTLQLMAHLMGATGCQIGRRFKGAASARAQARLLRPHASAVLAADLVVGLGLLVALSVLALLLTLLNLCSVDLHGRLLFRTSANVEEARDSVRKGQSKDLLHRVEEAMRAFTPPEDRGSLFSVRGSLRGSVVV